MQFLLNESIVINLSSNKEDVMLFIWSIWNWFYRICDVVNPSHLSWLISWNKKMSLKKCFSNFLQVLKDQFKSWVSNFFGEGFLRKSSLKIFTKNSKWNLNHNCHSICLFLGPQWFPLRKIFAQDVFGWPWLKKSTWETTSLFIQAIYCAK